MRIRLLILIGLFLAALYGASQWVARAAFRATIIASIAAPMVVSIALAYLINERKWNLMSAVVLIPLTALSIYLWHKQGDTVRRAGFFQRVPDGDKHTEVRYR